MLGHGAHGEGAEKRRTIDKLERNNRKAGVIESDKWPGRVVLQIDPPTKTIDKPQPLKKSIGIMPANEAVFQPTPCTGLSGTTVR